MLTTRTTFPTNANPTRGSRATPVSLTPTQDERFLPGTLLAGRYRINGLIARGGMGEIYRADDLKLGQAVALKFLPITLSHDEGRLTRLLGEVRTARQISHPNVCRVYDIGEVDGQHFISMEYVDGEDLASLLRRIGRLPKSKAIQIAREMCAGLAAAHDIGILHRDLKPANVMLDGRGRVKLADFGLAAAPEAVIGDEIGAGTPGYMAPEQLSGHGVSIRSDIYSLGAVLYEVFSGKPAFDASSLAELKQLQETSVPTSPSSIVDDFDPLVERLLARCLEADPQDRPATARSVAAALPGADPLAAALAAGETPSPEMVASAGDARGLAGWIAVGCVAITVVAFVASALMNRHSRIEFQVPLRKPPVALASDAQEILRDLGWTAEPVDSAYGFRYLNDYVRWVTENDDSVDRWRALPGVRPAPIDFWYREGPRAIVPVMQGWGVDLNDPPQTHSGEASVVLDPQARLVEFLVLPPQVESEAPTVTDPDWSALFRHAGLDEALLSPVAPKWNPLVDCDERAAWEGTYPGQPEIPIRIEAGAWRGKSIWFRVIAPWTIPQRMERARDNAEVAVGAITIVLLFGILGGALLLVRRNLQLGRGDRRGATRLSVYVFSVSIVQDLLLGHHVVSPGEIGRALDSVSRALLTAGMGWIVYLAVEPYVRRMWPESLISWSRLLTGRVRDSRVARDVLLGAAAGAILTLFRIAARQLPGWLGFAPRAPDSVLPIWLDGLRQSLGALAALHLGSLLFPVVLLFVALVARLALRRDWIALAVVVVGAGLIEGIASERLWASVPLTIVAYTIVFLVLLRLGLVSALVMIFIGNVAGALPLTLDTSSWFFGQSLLAMTIVISLLALAAWQVLQEPRDARPGGS